MTDTVELKRLEEMLAGLEGVTPGPWQVIEQKHEWSLPARAMMGHDIPAQAGEHLERRIFTTWEDGQLKSPFPVVNSSIGIGKVGEPSVQMVWMDPAVADHIARCDPDTMRSILTDYLRLRRPSAEQRATAGVVAKGLVFPNGKVARCDRPDSADWAKSWTLTDAAGKIATNVQDWELVEEFGLTAILSAIEPAPIVQEGESHPDDVAVDRFASAMKAKLAKKRAEGRGGWENKEDCSQVFLSSLLHGHVIKGVPVDEIDRDMIARGDRIGAALARSLLAVYDQHSTLSAEVEGLKTLNADLLMQAKGHAQEARAANSTIYEIYQVLSGGKGEPGNWNGAEPARRYVEAAEARLKLAEEVIRPFAEGSIDVSGAAIIIGYPQAKSAQDAARTFIQGDGK